MSAANERERELDAEMAEAAQVAALAEEQWAAKEFSSRRDYIIRLHRAQLSRKPKSSSPEAALDECDSIANAADALASALTAASLEVEERIFRNPLDPASMKVPTSLQEMGPWQVQVIASEVAALAAKARAASHCFEDQKQDRPAGIRNMVEWNGSLDLMLMRECAELLTYFNKDLERLRAFAAEVKAEAVGGPISPRWGEALAQRVKKEGHLHTWDETGDPSV